uniref:Bet v I/Major latex protein domain-containing protein n=1 Tax=Chenopodium quinoa TaxID=63459 RepID=A0A803LBT2_CHEQI
MAQIRSVEGQVELKCHPDKFFDVWASNAHLISKRSPNKIAKVELVDGEWNKWGSREEEMAQLQRIESQIELKCHADKFFEVWASKAHLISKITPNKVAKVELVEGEWDKIITVRPLNFGKDKSGGAGLREQIVEELTCFCLLLSAARLFVLFCEALFLLPPAGYLFFSLLLLWVAVMLGCSLGATRIFIRFGLDYIPMVRTRGGVTFKKRRGLRSLTGGVKLKDTGACIHLDDEDEEHIDG